MKRFLFLGIAATAMLASCTNDETVEMNPQNAIGFETFVDKSTRVAEDVTTDDFDAFELYGWRTKGTTTEQIFDAQAVTASSGVWEYSPLQYWVGGYNYTFEAVAPKSGEGGVIFNDVNGSSTIEFVSDAETDLIYASNSRDLTTTAPTNTAVNLTFNHLLSRVKFTFINDAAASSAATITVSDVTITGVGTTGVYTPSTETWAAATATGAVTFASSITKSITNIGGGDSGETEHKYLIPFDVEDYTISFTITMYQKQTSNSNAVSDTFTYSENYFANLQQTVLEKGNSYNFIFTFDPGHPITFTAEVYPWNNFADVTIP